MRLRQLKPRLTLSHVRSNIYSPWKWIASIGGSRSTSQLHRRLRPQGSIGTVDVERRPEIRIGGSSALSRTPGGSWIPTGAAGLSGGGCALRLRAFEPIETQERFAAADRRIQNRGLSYRLKGERDQRVWR